MFVVLQFETFSLNTVTVSGATKLFALLCNYVMYISPFSDL
jgi:hypothetical protein